MPYANGEDRQAPPETDSNISTDLWKCLSISTDYKNDLPPSFACFSQVPAVRWNEAEASCLAQICTWETGQRNASSFLHWVRKQNCTEMETREVCQQILQVRKGRPLASIKIATKNLLAVTLPLLQYDLEDHSCTP